MKSKFRFIFTALITLILCFSLSGCKEWNWQFEQSVENIEKIEIVDVKAIWLGNDYLHIDTERQLYAVKKALEKDTFEDVISDLESIIVGRYFGDPVAPFGLGFKVTFKNGDFDLLTLCEPRHYYKQENDYFVKKEWLDVKNVARFEELLAKWSE